MLTQTKIFKICPSCNVSWKTRDEFLADPSLKFIGYQMNFNHLGVGLFLFNHPCMTTLAVQAGKFFNLYHGPIFTERRVGNSECPEYCLHQSNMHVCPIKCECAFVREVMQIIKTRHVQAEYQVTK